MKIKILVILIVLAGLGLGTLVSAQTVFSRSLKQGMRGDDVRQLQEFLKTTPDIYPEGLVTGYFGPLTEAAVKRFQAKNNIESIGIVGPKTRAKLNGLVVRPKNISTENTSITGKGWVKTIDWVHACKESCPAEFQTDFPSHGILRQTSDGSFVMVGGKSNLWHTADGQIVEIYDPAKSGADSRYHVYFLKIDAKGNLWNKTYDDLGIGYDIKQTSDGGYIIAVDRAWSKLYGNKGDYIMKTDANGNKQWDKAFMVCGGYHSQPNFIFQTSGGGYLIMGLSADCGAGKTSSNNKADLFWFKTDANGNKMWEKSVMPVTQDSPPGFPLNPEIIDSVFQTSDGGYMIVIYTTGPGERKEEPRLIKIDANGNILWSKTPLEGYTHNVGASVRQVSDGGFILIQGKMKSEGELYALKLDADGNKLWEKMLKFSSFPDVSIMSAVQAPDGGYMAVAKKYVGENDFYLVRFDENGRELWYKRHNVVPSTIDNADNRLGILSIQQASDGGYILSGILSDLSGTTNYQNRKYYIIKTDANGDL